MRAKSICECCGVGEAITEIEIGLITYRACRMCADPDGTKEQERRNKLSYSERLKEFGHGRS